MIIYLITIMPTCMLFILTKHLTVNHSAYWAPILSLVWYKWCHFFKINTVLKHIKYRANNILLKSHHIRRIQFCHWWSIYCMASKTLYAITILRKVLMLLKINVHSFVFSKLKCFILLGLFPFLYECNFLLSRGNTITIFNTLHYSDWQVF